MESLLYDERIRLQRRLDEAKTHQERNRLGQFATPPELATEILQVSKMYREEGKPVCFLEPGFGTGAFLAALQQVFPADGIKNMRGVEIDPHYGVPARQLWESTNLDLKVADFTQLHAPSDERDKANLLVCNPPYVRHHYLGVSQKRTLQERAQQATGIRLNGLAGLYCYFLLISHNWLARNGVSCWLIPGEFLDVNYGQKVKRYLLSKVKLLRVHRFNPANSQFDDALVSSVVVWFRNVLPCTNDAIEFTSGGTLKEPQQRQRLCHSELRTHAKWSHLFSKELNKERPISDNPTCISDLFRIKRGIATGANKYFILTPEQIQQHGLPQNLLTPILPSPRYLSTNELLADENGVPCHTRNLFLLNCKLPEEQIRRTIPALWEYLQYGKRQAIDQRYLCRHRSPWYAQENRPPAPILCTYMGRGERPFRFILNHTQATAPNVYLMLYPKAQLQQQIEKNPHLLTKIWTILGQLQPRDLIKQGRVYGGGLYKLEPKELGRASLDGYEHNLAEIVAPRAIQLSLF